MYSFNDTNVMPTYSTTATLTTGTVCRYLEKLHVSWFVCIFYSLFILYGEFPFDCLVFSTTSSRPWPPDIDVSNVFYSDEVYCCPSTLIYNHNTQMTDTTVPFDALSHVIPNMEKTQKSERHDCNLLSSNIIFIIFIYLCLSSCHFH